MIYLRSLLFSLGMIISLVLIVLTGMFTIVLPHRLRYAHYTKWARFTVWWLKVTCGVKYEVEGTENIPKGNGIVFSKHQSTWETMGLQLVFPAQTWVLKRELLWVPVFGWGMAMLKPVAIDRGAGRKAVFQVIERGTARLKEGLWVIIFPEGTRTKPGTRKKHGIGGAVLAEKSGFPVVPVAHNAGEHWPKRGFLKKPGTIKVVVGPVIDTVGKTAQEIASEAEEWIESKSIEISNLKK